MVNSSVPEMNGRNYGEIPIRKVLGMSLLFHILVIVVLPFLARYFWNPVEFERPQTFELVQIPLPPSRPKPVPKEVVPEQPAPPTPEVKPEPKPVPPEKPAEKPPEPKPVETPRAVEEPAAPVAPVEDLDELEALLSEIPVPVAVSAPGDFKQHHYLNLVRQRIERHWTPPTENPNISVVVEFTIHKDGSISGLSIKQSSGQSTLDNLALRAVTLAAPFSRLPYGFADDKLDLTITLIPARK